MGPHLYAASTGADDSGDSIIIKSSGGEKRLSCRVGDRHCSGNAPAHISKTASAFGLKAVPIIVGLLKDRCSDD